MSEQTFFTTADCSGWLVQLAVAKERVHDPLQSRPQLAFWGQRLGVAWASWSVSLTAMCILWILSGMQQGLNRFQLSSIKFFWTIAQIPLIILVTQLHLEIGHDDINRPIPDDPNDNPMSPRELAVHHQRLLNAWQAVQQWVTICLVMVIWLAVTQFKKIQAELVKDSYWRRDLERKLDLETKASMAFGALNLLWQIIFFILVNSQIHTGLMQIINPDELMPAQELNNNVRNLAVVVGIVNGLFILGFFGLMGMHLLSFLQIASHSIESPMFKGILFGVTPLLAILFMNDVFSMMLYYWGAPTFTMTQSSFNIDADGNIQATNTDPGCRSFLITEQIIINEEREVHELTSLGWFMRIILSISEFTPLVWSFVLALVFLGTQVGYGNAVNHSAAADNRQGLVQKNQRNINNTTDLHSSGQPSLDQSNKMY